MEPTSREEAAALKTRNDQLLCQLEQLTSQALQVLALQRLLRIARTQLGQANRHTNAAPGGRHSPADVSRAGRHR